MPAGYSARCKVCNSPYRVQIEKWAKEDGLSSKAISAKLAREFQVRICRKSIWHHLKVHFDVKTEARELYQKSQANLKKAVERHLSDIGMLDSIAQGNYELHESVRQWLAELVAKRAKVPRSLVDLLATTAGEVRQSLRAKLELLGEDGATRMADALAQLTEELADVISATRASGGDMEEES